MKVLDIVGIIIYLIINIIIVYSIYNYYNYYNTNKETLLTCLDGYSLIDQKCHKCPLGSITNSTSTNVPTNISGCYCSDNYIWNGTHCEFQCPTGTSKTNTGHVAINNCYCPYNNIWSDNQCKPCLGNSLSVIESGVTTSITGCYCPFNTEWINNTCTPINNNIDYNNYRYIDNRFVPYTQETTYVTQYLNIYTFNMTYYGTYGLDENKNIYGNSKDTYFIVDNVYQCANYAGIKKKRYFAVKNNECRLFDSLDLLISLGKYERDMYNKTPRQGGDNSISVYSIDNDTINLFNNVIGYGIPYIKIYPPGIIYWFGCYKKLPTFTYDKFYPYITYDSNDTYGTVHKCAYISALTNYLFFAIDDKNIYIAPSLDKFNIVYDNNKEICKNLDNNNLPMGRSNVLSVYQISNTQELLKHFLPFYSIQNNRLYSYGCFKDTRNREPFIDDNKLLLFGLNDPDAIMACINETKSKGKKFFGIEAQNECRLANSLADLITLGESDKCENNDRGGSWSFNAFEII